MTLEKKLQGGMDEYEKEIEEWGETHRICERLDIAKRRLESVRRGLDDFFDNSWRLKSMEAGLTETNSLRVSGPHLACFLL